MYVQCEASFFIYFLSRAFTIDGTAGIFPTFYAATRKRTRVSLFARIRETFIEDALLTELPPRDREVVGLNPEGCWAFIFSVTSVERP